jgi:hypothetical protein
MLERLCQFPKYQLLLSRFLNDMLRASFSGRFVIPFPADKETLNKYLCKELSPDFVMDRTESEILRREQWRIVGLINDFPSTRKTGSLGNICRHLLDVTKVDVSSLHRALSLELGLDAATRFGNMLHIAFRCASSSNSSSTSVAVDARWIVSIFRAATLAPAAFHDPRVVFLKLAKDYCLECKGGECSEHSILLSDALRIASIATDTDEDVQSMTMCLKKCIRDITTSSTISTKILEEALALCPDVLSLFRTQLLDKISDDNRLELLAEEEVRLMYDVYELASQCTQHTSLTFVYVSTG